MYYLWMGDHIVLAANVGAHFIANNLLMFGFVMLWVHGHFWIAEVMLLINFGNLTVLYHRHSTSPLLVHIPVVSGPLAWNFVAIFWCGAAATNAHTLAARIVANIFVWTWLLYGLFYLAVFKDYTMGFAMSVLAAGITPLAHYTASLSMWANRHSFGIAPVPYQGCRSPVDLCLCNHGYSLCAISCNCPTAYVRKAGHWSPR